MQYQRLAVFLLCGMLAMAGCGGGGGGNNDNTSDTGTTEVTTDPGTTEVTATITGPASSKAGRLSKAAIPSQAASVTLDVKTPDCSGSSVYNTKMDTAGQTSAAFNFTLTAGSAACFTAGAYSGAGGVGTLLYQGSTSGINLVAGESVNVEISLSEVGAVKPTVTSGAATSIGATAATLNATINPNGFETTAYFEWGLDTSYGNTTPIQTIGSGTANVAISQALTGLTAGTTYHYRAVANNSGNTVYGTDQSLTTINTTDSGVTVTFPSTSAPTATTNAAISVTGTGATLNATVNPQGSATTAYFEWGTTTSYGNTTAWQEIGNGTADTTVSAALTGLTTGTTYHYRIVAYNAHGLAAGADGSFSFIAMKMPDTNQTASYTTTFGEDSDYTINPPSYTDNGDGTVTDNVTGLMWQKQDDATTRTWADAGTYCDASTLGGYSDWRLPSQIELISIIDNGVYNPAINTTFFPGTISAFYWSSTSDAYITSVAWNVYFGSGSSANRYKTDSYYVRCIRGELTTSSLTDNGNGTVTDSGTLLTWQQGENSTMTWEAALSYCEGLSLAGSTDWRLPNHKELFSLVDYTRYNPAINTTLFPSAVSSYYWSSTTYASSTSNAWNVGFGYGDSGSFNKTNSYYVRCVRGGQ